MLNIKDKTKCTGCYACAQICPKKCIQMHEDVEGFKYPIVDMTECIKCSMCIKTCPVLNNKHQEKKTIASLAVKRIDDTLRLKSSSGGVFSVIAEYFILHGGVVFGASFTKEWSVKHIKAENISDLQSLIGTKYIQSEIGDTYKEVQQELKGGKKVLFTGTPCQIAGLYSFLKKDYLNLYTIDLICHGVPSFKVFNEFLKEQCGQKKIIDISFRDKKAGWTKYNLVLVTIDEGKKKYLRYAPDKNIFMKNFISNLYLRPSCHNCSFKYNRSRSDITLGDFWGIEQIAPDFYDEKGVSAVLVNSISGQKIIDRIKDDIFIKKVSYKDILYKNRSLVVSSSVHAWRDYFFQNLGYLPFSQIIKNIEYPSIQMRVRRKFRSFFKSML